MKDLMPRKRSFKKPLAIFIAIILILLVLFYLVSKFYDTYKVLFQTPVLMQVRLPIVISKRLIVGSIPQAQYVQISPLTTPQQIVDAVKQNTIPNYITSGSITPISKQTIKDLVHNKVVQKWGEDAWLEIDYLINKESGWSPYIVNRSSGATGLFQALPATKLASLDIIDQINFGINYIEKRYKNPQNAKAHEVSNNWY